MRRAFTISLGFLSVLALTLIFIFATDAFGRRSDRLDQYLCERCAMKREVISKRRFGVPVGGSDRVASTRLSREMGSGTRFKCDHAWILTFYDFHLPGVSGHGGVNSQFALHFLTESDEGAAGIVSFSRSADRPASAVWQTLFRHLANFPRGETSPLENWVFDGNIGETNALEGWFRENYDSLQVITNE
jgi:hypothetical protein